MKGKAAMRLRKVFTALVGLGVLLPPLVVAVAALSGSDHRWPDILVQFTAPALVATVMAGLVLVLIRRFRWAIGALVVAGLLTVAVWPQWWPQASRADPDAARVRLYSANVYVENTDVARLRASIRAADPDIIVLIEVGAEMVPQLEEILRGYPHRTRWNSEPRDGGTESLSLIASRYPQTERRPYIDHVHAVGAVVDTPVGPLNVIGVHFTRPWPFQYQWGQINQATALSAYVPTLTGPVVVAGDFNSVVSGRIGRLIRQESGMRPATGWPGTWPAALPAPLTFTIDQVWTTPDLAIAQRRLGRRNGSDHRPVVTDLTLAVRPARP